MKERHVPNKRSCHNFGVGGFCFHDDKVLLVKHSYGVAKGQWCQPGGFVDIGEVPTKALEREIFEETGVKVKTSNLIVIRHYNRKSKSKEIISDICFFYRVEYISGEPIPDLDEIEDAKFIPITKIDDYPLTNLCKTILDCFIKNKGLVLQKYKPPKPVEKALDTITYQLYH